MSHARTRLGGAMCALALTAGALPANAADVCMLAKVETDPFTSVETTDFHDSSFDIKLKGDEVSMVVALGGGGTVQQSLPAGIEVLLLLENGTKVTLVSHEPASPVNVAHVSEYSASFSTWWRPRFLLTLEAVHALAGSPVEHMKFDIGDVRSVEAKGKAWQGLRRDMACVANMLGG